jgi:GT2 family glycosyltransferase
VNAAVVIATHDRPDGLARCLGALAAGMTLPDEIVVVDDGSDPAVDIAAIAGELPVKLLRNDVPKGPAAARNLGWRATSAELVLFTDDDCRPSPAWVAEMLAAAASDVVLVGRTLPDPADGSLRTPLDRSLLVESCDGCFPTGNAAYPRAVLEELGGFDETFLQPYGEDTDLGQRAIEAGCRGAFVNGALVLHAIHRQSWLGALRERRRLAELPRLATVHPRLREEPWNGNFWNSEHRMLVGAALAGLRAPGGIAVAARRDAGSLQRTAAAASAAVALLPAARYVYWCCRRARELSSENWAANAVTWFALDAFEIATLAYGSVRYRTLLL